MQPVQRKCSACLLSETSILSGALLRMHIILHRANYAILTISSPAKLVQELKKSGIKRLPESFC